MLFMALCQAWVDANYKLVHKQAKLILKSIAKLMALWPPYSWCAIFLTWASLAVALARTSKWLRGTKLAQLFLRAATLLAKTTKVGRVSLVTTVIIQLYFIMPTKLHSRVLSTVFTIYPYQIHYTIPANAPKGVLRATNGTLAKSLFLQLSGLNLLHGVYKF